MWDVKTKVFNAKHFRLTLQLTEFNLKSLSLGWDLHHSKSRFNSFRHYLHLTLDFGPAGVGAYLSWGGKPDRDRMLDSLKQK